MWPPTGLIPWFSKTEGNTYATLLHHPFLFKGKPTQCSRGSKKDFWHRCRGDSQDQVKIWTPDNERFLAPLPGSLRKSQHTKYPSQTLISRITLFASRFPLPHFTLAVLFALSFSFASFSLAFFCSCVGLLVCHDGSR